MKNLNEQLVTFITAKLAKEIGFGRDFTGTYYVPAFYSEDGVEARETEFHIKDCSIDDRYFRPSQSVLNRYLREKYKLIITPTYGCNDQPHWSVNIANVADNLDDDGHVLNSGIDFKPGLFETYEAALETGLQIALKLIR